LRGSDFKLVSISKKNRLYTYVIVTMWRSFSSQCWSSGLSLTFSILISFRLLRSTYITYPQRLISCWNQAELRIYRWNTQEYIKYIFSRLICLRNSVNDAFVRSYQLKVIIPITIITVDFLKNKLIIGCLHRIWKQFFFN
jgi:hypothetical protein